MTEEHPIESYLILLRSLQKYLETDAFFGFKEIPQFGVLPPLEIPIESEEDIPVYPEAESTLNPNREVARVHTPEEVSPPVHEQNTRSTLPPEIKKSELAKIEIQVANCTSCRLASTRTHTVFGAGNVDAELVFIGEAPGADEDRQGVPFVGKAGQLLTRIIESIQLTRDEVYILNLIKCRPPGNRDPKPDEIEQCRHFFLKQLNYLEPSVICTLGKFASQNLLSSTLSISRMRGQTYYWNNIPVIPTFHPSYLLRNEHEKRKVWEDMKKIRELLKNPPQK